MGNDETQRQLLEEINKKLTQVVGLLAIQGKDPDTQISVLEGLGFDSAAIGQLVGLSGSAIRGRKFRRGGNGK